MSFNDLRTRMTLRVGAQQVGFIQDFQSMATLMSAMFGGKDGGGSDQVEEKAYEPKTVAELQLAVKRLFGGGP